MTAHSFGQTPARSAAVAPGGGLPIHPDLFVLIDFRLFCLRWTLLSCTEVPRLRSKVQQMFSKKCQTFPRWRSPASNNSPGSRQSRNYSTDERKRVSQD